MNKILAATSTIVPGLGVLQRIEIIGITWRESRSMECIGTLLQEKFQGMRMNIVTYNNKQYSVLDGRAGQRTIGYIFLAIVSA
jgi:hypothetical protein